MPISSTTIINQVEKLTSIGISLSKEKNLAKLLEKILIGAKEITQSDGGTLYLIKNEMLNFEILRTDSLGFAMGGTTDNPITLPPINLFLEDKTPNYKNISAFSAVTGKTVNIPDAYCAEGFDFQGVKAFDEKHNYHSKSFLTVPMKNHENAVIGVLQLINHIDPDSKEVTYYSNHEQKLAESLASQAAIAITNYQLVNDLKELLEKFIEVIASAIDDKSGYTGGHCRRVPEIAVMLAKAISNTKIGKFKDIEFNEKEMYELHIAALMHDCGKITTPVHVVDKATKLETIYDRIEIVKARSETLKKDAELKMLKIKLESSNELKIKKAENEYHNFVQKINDDIAFLQSSNIGSEYMNPDAIKRIQEISKHSWISEDGKSHNLLTEDEIKNLSIPKGTLTNDERKIVNHHIVMTQKMLEALPFPRHLKNVPEIAGNHHERMDGKGYPRGIKGENLSIQARLMCIADIFEALTADDRPYKKAMNLSVALRILGEMKLDEHIDPDIFNVFINEKVYLQYANKFLETGQIDKIDIKGIPGCQTG